MIEAARIAFVGEAPGLAEFLRGQGFAVERLADPAAGSAEAARRRFDLFLVQTAHLTAETIDLCQRSAGAGAAPCVLIVSDAADDEERIQALEAGAADCLAEPVNLREVRARVRAVLRRLQRPKPVAPGWTFGGWTLDPARRELRAPSGMRMILPLGEFALLRSLVTDPQQVLSRAVLQSLSSLSERALNGRVMDVRIARLRARFTRAGGPDFIQTVRGEGYLFASPVQKGD
ncbi:response regulator transcription factor [Phenylobacterium sp.]|uniref:winged helix-turn-helix domain-containing protein n=1 Tax=Phenylobacterium sp. TaxID=1871053 RepID=UPI0025DB570B|nr:response regulator transcription factor [Phenylobacterium sp.]